MSRPSGQALVSNKTTNLSSIIMKKFVLALVALSIASVSYASSGCGGCKGEKKSDEKKAEQKA